MLRNYQGFAKVYHGFLKVVLRHHRKSHVVSNGCPTVCPGHAKDSLILSISMHVIHLFDCVDIPDGCCVETCFLAAHEAFPACDDEKQLIFSYFASLTAIGDDVVICDPPFVDAWWTDLGGTPGGI